MANLVAAFGIVAIVLVVSALGSRFVERAPISFPMLFLAIGVLLGQRGLGVLRLAPDDELLVTIGVLCLSFVLFLDAINLRFDELGRHWLAPVMTLGPGTLLAIAVVGPAAHFLIPLPWAESFLLSAVLASIDPVVTRDVLRDERIPGAIRGTLGIEAGMNDVVVLPVVLVLIAVLQARSQGASDWALFVLRVFALAPLAGAVVGGGGAWAMAKVDARYGVRREYQALYGVGLVLASYAAGEAAGGDGFLAAFAAGLTVTLTNYDLCDCFLEYGEVTAEMTMLLAFILFGAVLSGIVGLAPALASVVLGLFAVFVARPLVTSLVLRSVDVSRSARLFIGWFGPRGLSSLLFALLAVERGVRGSTLLLAVTGIVVGVSVVTHGVTATPVTSWYARVISRRALAEERESATGLFHKEKADVPRVTPEELARMLAGPDPPVVLDVRLRSAYAGGPGIPGSVHVLPDQVRDWAARQDLKRRVVAYCT